MESSYLSSSYLETQKIAAELARDLKSGTTICLYGDLASGKTTFTQGLGHHFGLGRLVSPTFIIMRQYAITGHPVIKTLFHLDLYRLESLEDIKAFDLNEIWSDPENLLVIEWPEKLGDLLPSKRLDIFFSLKSEDQREIKIVEHL